MAKSPMTNAPMDAAPHDPGGPSAGETWEARLHSTLEQQESIVDRLEALGARQARAVEARTADELLSILGERQILIDAFAGTQQTVVTMAQSLQDEPTLLDEAARGVVRTRIATISERLSLVMERDARDQVMLEEAAGAIKQELNQMGVARQAHRAYGGPAQDGVRYADTQG